MIRFGTSFIVALLAMCKPAAAADELFAFVQMDRLEYQEHEREWLWDLQGWVGGDDKKVWIKTEGEIDGDNAAGAELQFLYSNAISPFWDLQLGIRHDLEPDPSVTYGVVGFQGLAPQWFEVDVAAFVSDDGDISARLETEYDLLLTQRLVLQPRLELNSRPETAELGLRLRYEVKREIAPYIGLSWQKQDRRSAFVSLVAGATFWF